MRIYYVVGLMSLGFISVLSTAQNLEQQFSLWLSNEKDKIECFSPEASFKYCLGESLNGGSAVFNLKGEEIYQLYYFDNWPDEAQDGVYRIRKEDKIGFADAITGEIVIDAIYDCAYPFEAGKAKVGIGCEIQTDGEHSWWVGGNWTTITR
ncbi:MULTISPECIES: WG repeat-containing protein [Providencia]|uniref:WG repeat-containing protein n=2 Tax=Morganellaceae TaxID=1903414 RepID=A0AAD2VRL5_PRORE|nr:WG repeat-containing protein [Providencia rettgeri]ELR5217957.1 WG repeat-containing protein [Providencia rettgeri]ELR5224192.1 WG repeat-containing protein [Providencia rettgeri]MDX7324322.1 WG repeat-containing protein [Providencia rettgeri]HEC8323572.1 WG repeat-containing protein [Providencia rettgeri]